MYVATAYANNKAAAILTPQLHVHLPPVTLLRAAETHGVQVAEVGLPSDGHWGASGVPGWVPHEPKCPFLSQLTSEGRHTDAK